MIRTRRSRVTAIVVPLIVGLAACGGSDENTNGAGAAPTDVAVAADRCIVRLHGKGGRGAPATVGADGIAVLSPDGNGTGWGGLQWEYDTDAGLAAGVERITAVTDEAGCERVVVHGFSNGASMAAATLCSGEDLGGRLDGVIIDDPVTDASTQPCTPADVPVTVYWTGALDETAPPGTQCDTIDWTCEGGVVRGIEVFTADIGVTATASPFDEHQWYVDSPLPVTWLG